MKQKANYSQIMSSGCMNVRPSWDKYFIQISEVVSTRSTCLTYQVGCVVVRDKQILVTGYNGPPSGTPHCTEQGCCYPGLSQCGKGLGLPSRAIHAEMNAIAQAAKRGVSISGASIYVTKRPCLDCLKAIVASGIVEVVHKRDDSVNWYDRRSDAELTYLELIKLRMI